MMKSVTRNCGSDTATGWSLTWKQPARFVLVSLLVMASICGHVTLAAPVQDQITDLPLYGKPPAPQYSGYLDATAGCNTSANGPYCKLHYWFAAWNGEGEGNDNDETDKVETQVIQNDKPVILWLNGGPGSSSVVGFLQELGPLLLNATGGLMDNPYSWTVLANVFILESPVGVGYSYCANQLIPGNVCENTDKYTASAARAALQDFFNTKFPELKDNPFYITGESYAGVYIPTLAYEILTHSSPEEIPLTGLAVGDPCTDNTAQNESMDAVWYGHKYGLVDDAVYDLLWNTCNVRLPNFLQKPFSRSAQQTQLLLSKLLQEDTTKTTSVDEKMQETITDPWLHLEYPVQAHDSLDCKLAFRKFLLSTSRALSQSWNNMYIDDYSLFAPVTDAEDAAMAAYMNRDDVKQALHVTDTPIVTWPYPEAGFDYTKEYDACHWDGEGPILETSMIEFYRKIVPRLPGPVFVYNGDTDPCLSYEGTRTAILRVGFPELDGGSYRPWFYNHTATTLDVITSKSSLFGPDLLLQDTGAQFGGEVVNYEHGLSFLTVHGSGHMVPQFRPQAALHMLDKLLSNQLLTPLLPSNETLQSMCDKCFEKVLDDWTVRAKTAPFVTPMPPTLTPPEATDQDNSKATIQQSETTPMDESFSSFVAQQKPMLRSNSRSDEKN